MRTPEQVLLKPVVSEKSYALMDKGVYVFVVASDATKVEVRQSVEEIFGVRVTRVNTLNRQGKKRRNRKSNTTGRRPDTKRAMVTLVDGDRIDLFERS